MDVAKTVVKGVWDGFLASLNWTLAFVVFVPLLAVLAAVVGMVLTGTITITW